ncbi:hypothetical protein [Flaviaesturariibacter flavus]|nr:hypothetical protein [Flaviaesturariibacter flavus]
MPQLKELVGLDGLLCGSVFKPDTNDDEFWEFVVIEESVITSFFTSLSYVRSKVTGIDCNILAVVMNPEIECLGEVLPGFEFLGYDLLDYHFDISPLTNCGGFDETFLPEELNQYGLLTSQKRAREVYKMLPENNPDEDHAECNYFAVWRLVSPELAVSPP